MMPHWLGSLPQYVPMPVIAITLITWYAIIAMLYAVRLDVQTGSTRKHSFTLLVASLLWPLIVYYNYRRYFRKRRHREGPEDSQLTHG